MELIDEIDENGIQTGFKYDIDYIHKMGLCHKAIQVIVMDSNNNILIQQRSKNKRFFPNCWDMTISGHVSSGEMSTEACVREIYEEVGLHFNASDLNFLFSFKDYITGNNVIENLFFDIFYIKKDFNVDSIKLQESEVQDYKIVDIKYIKELFKDKILLENVETRSLIKILEEKICANNWF